MLTLMIFLVGIWWFDWISNYLDGITPQLAGRALVDAVSVFVSRLAVSTALAMAIVGTASAYKGWQTLGAGEYLCPGMWVNQETRLLIREEAESRGR